MNNPRPFILYSLLLAGGLSLILFVSYGSAEQEEANVHSDTLTPPPVENLPQVIRSIDLDKTYAFAGEEVPIDNEDVMERLDRELSINTYWHSNTLLNIKNANKYFPEIEKILRQNGVPEDLKYLAVAESSLRHATSPAGAKGFWQILKSTGESYGLEVNDNVDERNHLEKSTVAACKFLKESYQRFGSWSLAAAAYNMGGSRLARLLEEQKAESYYELNVGEETSRYFFRLVALKELMENPENYGFYVKEEHLYKPITAFREVEVNYSIDNLGDFAKENGTDYRTLKIYNPWLMTSKLPNSRGKIYKIKLPKES